MLAYAKDGIMGLNLDPPSHNGHYAKCRSNYGGQSPFAWKSGDSQSKDMEGASQPCTSGGITLS